MKLSHSAAMGDDNDDRGATPWRIDLERVAAAVEIKEVVRWWWLQRERIGAMRMFGL